MLWKRLFLFPLMLSAGPLLAGNSLPWGAIADGETFDFASGKPSGNVGAAAVGFDFGSSEGEAIQKAIVACRTSAAQARIPVTCAIASVWNEGCRYAILGGGHLPNGRAIEAVGTGETLQDAQAALRQLLRGVTDLKLGQSHGSCLGTASAH
jgi:hypothetical protein